MRKEPWFMRNIFWILTLISAGLSCLAFWKHKDLGAIAFATVSFITLLIGTYFATSVDHYAQQRDEYQKAHYYQARKKTLKVLKGGKQ